MNKRNRLSLAPVETGGVFRLELTASLGGLAAGGPKSDRARQALLISDFGSRKKQKMEVSRQANIVDVRAIAAASEVGHHLQAATAAAVSAGKADNSGSATAAASTDAATGAARGTVGAKLEATLLAGRIATLPPFDASADSPEQAYPLSGILSMEVLEALEPDARRVVRAMDAGGLEDSRDATVSELSRGSLFVADRLRVLLSLRLLSKHTTEAVTDGVRRSVAKTRGAALSFLAMLLQLHRAPNTLYFRLQRPPTEAAVAGGSDDAAAPDSAEPAIPSLAGIQPSAVHHLVGRFAEARPTAGEAAAAHPFFFVRTEELRDRLIAHAAILALIIDGFSTDVRLLASDLRMPVAKLATMLREAGCSAEPVRESGAIVSYSATLKAPLVFPKLKFGRR